MALAKNMTFMCIKKKKPSSFHEGLNLNHSNLNKLNTFIIFFTIKYFTLNKFEWLYLMHMEVVITTNLSII